jgi:hypothetical protein
MAREALIVSLAAGALLLPTAVPLLRALKWYALLLIAI